MAGWLARLPVRVRLTAWYLGLLAVILATLGSFLLLRLRADLVAETDQVLDTQAVAILADTDAGARLDTIPPTGVAGLPAGDTAVQLLSPTGAVLDRAGPATPERPLLTSAMVRRVLAGHQVRAEMRPGPLHVRYRVLGLRRPARSAPPHSATSTDRSTGCGCCWVSPARSRWSWPAPAAGCWPGRRCGRSTR